MNIDDWRIRDQEDYLVGETLMHKRFISNLHPILMPSDDPRKYNDHEHCAFCLYKFMEDCSIDRYCTLDEKNWICQKCFDDFKELFKWSVIEELTEGVR